MKKNRQKIPKMDIRYLSKNQIIYVNGIECNVIQVVPKSPMRRFLILKLRENDCGKVFCEYFEDENKMTLPIFVGSNIFTKTYEEYYEIRKDLNIKAEENYELRKKSNDIYRIVSKLVKIKDDKLEEIKSKYNLDEAIRGYFDEEEIKKFEEDVKEKKLIDEKLIDKKLTFKKKVVEKKLRYEDDKEDKLETFDSTTYRSMESGVFIFLTGLIFLPVVVLVTDAFSRKK